VVGKYKDEISKCQRQVQEFKKQSTHLVNFENTLCDTPAGQLEVTQQQYRAPAGGHVF
jgi:hypothetical protein